MGYGLWAAGYRIYLAATLGGIWTSIGQCQRHPEGRRPRGRDVDDRGNSLIFNGIPL